MLTGSTILIILATAGVFLLPRLITQFYGVQKIHTTEESPAAKVAIVFGAGLRRDGTPTAVLQDRVSAAAHLYHAGKVEKLLMSGDNRFVDYNEPGAMLRYAVDLGVPEKDIVLDYAGRRTYDTCYRAIHIFKVDSAVLVTQGFHLPRAIFICNQLGLKADGVSADLRYYTRFSRLTWFIRELPATLVALWDVWVFKPVPVLGKPEPVFPEETTGLDDFPPGNGTILARH